jgi:Tetratricopeptide repeat
MDGGKKAASASGRDKKASAGIILSRNPEQHGLAGIYIPESGAMNRSGKSSGESDEDRKDSTGARPTLSSIGSLASTYRNQGRWAEAEKLEMQVMGTSKTVLGTNHPDILYSMGDLASTYQGQRRWTEAKELQVQVVEASTTLLGPGHPFTLTSMANLALTYWNLGRRTEAEKLEEQVTEKRKTVFLANFSNWSRPVTPASSVRSIPSLRTRVSNRSPRAAVFFTKPLARKTDRASGMPHKISQAVACSLSLALTLYFAIRFVKTRQCGGKPNCQIEQLVCNKPSGTTLDNLGVFCGRVVYSDTNRDTESRAHR